MTSATEDTAEQSRPASRIGAGNTVAIAVDVGETDFRGNAVTETTVLS